MSSSSVRPEFRIRSPKRREYITKLTNEGKFNLSEGEEWWRDRYDLLIAHGYRMRPRYDPGWVPSWKDKDLDPKYCEDSNPLFTSKIMDAVRVSDNKEVVIKRSRRSRCEGPITEYFSTPERVSAEANHCVRVYEVFCDEEYEFIVMPLLREFDEPPFETVEQAIDFVSQTLEGLNYMHQEGVAHLDCSVMNIMMDGSSLFPNGFHPIFKNYDKDCLYHAKRKRRANADPVKYYFIDFGISVYTLQGDETETIGIDCQDRDVPELSDDVPYRVLPVDIFILGNVYKKKLLDVYSNLEFLRPLIEAMMQRDPSARPSSAAALSQFRQLQLPGWGAALRWRLHHREETSVQRVYGGAVACARETAFLLRSIAIAPFKLTKRLTTSISNVRI